MHWSKNPKMRAKVIAKLKQVDFTKTMHSPQARKKAGKSLSKTLRENPEILNKWRRFGEKNNGWKGGRYISKGYVWIRKPNHQNHNGRGYVLEHRFVVEQKIKRLLKTNEIVHHINGIKTDNRTENLSVISRGENSKIRNPNIKILQARIRELEKQLPRPDLT